MGHVRHNKIGKGLPVAAPYAAAQLVELPQAELLRLIHNERIGPREIKP